MVTEAFGFKRSVAATVAGLRTDPHAPFSAMIEIADRCNEVCVHCYQIQGQKGEMTTTELERVMDELAEMGVLFLTFSGGEATLRKDFLHLVGYARRHQFAVKLYTNGLTMTRDLAAALAALAVQEVQISLYSQRAEMHDWVTGVTGSFERTVAGAKHLIEAGVAVVLKTPLMSVNVGEYDEYIRFVTELGADFSLDPHLSAREDGNLTPMKLRLDTEEYLRIRRDPRLSGRTEGQVPKERAPDTRPCGACSGNVHIEANGEIRPCTQLAVPTGHALREGVRAAWRDDANARKIRELTWQDLHGCRECDLRSYCQRCFADGQREGADALGPYTSACRGARLKYAVVHGREPVIEAAGERDPDLGPYRALDPGPGVATHTFRAVPDVITDEDRRLATSYPWIRIPQMPSCEPLGRAQPGGLVQLRRPGKSAARVEQVPVGLGSTDQAEAVD